MKKLLTLFAIPLFAFTLSYAQDAEGAAEAAPETAADAPADGETAEGTIEQSALSADDERLFADIGKICTKRFCAIELFFKNGTYSQMTKSKSSLSNEELYDYDAGHSENGEFFDKDAQKRDIAEKLRQMCDGKEFCTLEATLHGPSFTLASLRNVTTDIRPKNQNVPRYDGIHYSTDTETRPFIVDATKAPPPVTRVAPAATAPAPETQAPMEMAASPAPAARNKPARSKANKDISHGIGFSLGILQEDTYGLAETESESFALEFSLRYVFNWRFHKVVALNIGAGIIYRTNELDIDNTTYVYNPYTNYYDPTDYYDEYAFVYQDGMIDYDGIALDFPISIRIGSLFYGSITADIRKPFWEDYYYEMEYSSNVTYSYDYEDDRYSDFFAASDFEFSLWLGTGFQYKGFGLGIQFLMANGASSDTNHDFGSIMSGKLSMRISAEYLF